MEYDLGTEKALHIGTLAAALNAEVHTLVALATAAPIPHTDMVRLIAPGVPGYMHVHAWAFNAVSTIVFTFALVLAIYVQRRWSGSSPMTEIMEVGHRVAAQVLEALMPKLLIWGSPEKIEEKKAKPSTYVARCTLHALRRIRRDEKKINDRLVSMSSHGTNQEGYPSSIDGADDAAMSADEQIARKQQVRILICRFTRDELRFIGGDIKLHQWVHVLRRARNRSHAHRQREAFIAQARQLLGLPKMRKKARRRRA